MLSKGAKADYYGTARRRFRLHVYRPRNRNVRYPSVQLCWVRLSLPKFVNGTNMKAIDRDTTAWALRKLERKLLRAGVKTDIMKAYLTRLDCFADVTTAEPVEHYLPLFGGLHLPRSGPVEYSRTGYLWTNGQYELGIYNKILEAQQRGEPVIEVPRGIIRFEYRLKTARRIRSELEIVTVRNLLDEYDRIEAHFRQVLRDTLFSHEVKGLKRYTGGQIESEMLAFKEMSRYGTADFVTACGYRYLEKRTTRAGLRKMLALDSARSVGDRRNSKAEDLLARLKLLRQARGTTKRLGDLQAELQSKLFGGPACAAPGEESQAEVHLEHARRSLAEVNPTHRTIDL